MQGGTGTERHVDGMLDALRFGFEERPRLVHRLDKDTSGLLLIARTGLAARRLGDSFRDRETEKLYWAVVVGMPPRPEGAIDLPLAKRPGARDRELMQVDEENGQKALTHFRVLDHAGKRAALLALWPRTGRTHQLRVHCAEIGCPILGDGKYGGEEALLSAVADARRLHLHARRLVLPHPSGKGELAIDASRRLTSAVPLKHSASRSTEFERESAGNARSLEAVDLDSRGGWCPSPRSPGSFGSARAICPVSRAA